MATFSIINQVQSDLITYTITVGDTITANATAHQLVNNGGFEAGTAEFNARMQIVADALENAVRTFPQFAIPDLNYANNWTYNPVDNEQGNLVVSFAIANATVVINTTVETNLTGIDLDNLMQETATNIINNFKNNPSYTLADI